MSIYLISVGQCNNLCCIRLNLKKDKLNKTGKGLITQLKNIRLLELK